METEVVTCDLCGSGSYHTQLQTRDYIFKVPGVFNIVKCDCCNLLYLNPRPDNHSLSKFYEQYYVSVVHNSSDLPSARASIKKNPVLRGLYQRITGEYLSEVLARAKGKVLDIGCGFGDLLNDLHLLGCEAYGVEINPDAVEVCRKGGFNVFNGKLQEARFEDNFFDAVIMWHVIEHLGSPRDTLLEVRRILKSGGNVFIYSPNFESYLSGFFGKYWSGLHLPFHFYFYTEATFHRLAEETGFKIERIRTATPEYFFAHSLAAYANESRNKLLLSFQRAGIFKSFAFRMLLSLLFRFLDLILRGKGECLRVELINKQIIKEERVDGAQS